MNNFEKFINNLTMEQFCDMIACSCGICPIYPCDNDDAIIISTECYEKLMKWCKDGEE